LGSVAVGMLLVAARVCAEEGSDPDTPQRPELRSNRWQEDWSALSDPALRTGPMDRLKYLRLFARDDPGRFVSLGANGRERMESNDAPGFGLNGQADTYLLQRLQMHADVNFNPRWRLFVQVEDVRSFGKADPSPTDRNPLDLRNAFIGYKVTLGEGTLREGTLMARLGRQDFAFEQQRFLSLRDGPNVRQSFDAALLRFERGDWEVSGFLSQPVQYNADEPFDDLSSGRLRFDLLRAEHHGPGDRSLSFFYARYAADDADYLDGDGQERRHVLDLRSSGAAGNWDWNVEAMVQGGDVGTTDVQAWALAARGGYTLTRHAWLPRLGIQIDSASGDRRRGDGRIETFNPLFPNGSYSFSLAGYTGYVNLVQLKPSIGLEPAVGVQATAAIGLLWRQSIADAVYLQPDIPVAATAGQPGRRTGAYAQLQAEWTLSRNVSLAAEFVHYRIADVLRDAGGSDSNYAGVELNLAW
jgi:hypothetical protein